MQNKRGKAARATRLRGLLRKHALLRVLSLVAAGAEVQQHVVRVHLQQRVLRWCDATWRGSVAPTTHAQARRFGFGPQRCACLRLCACEYGQRSLHVAALCVQSAARASTQPHTCGCRAASELRKSGSRKSKSHLRADVNVAAERKRVALRLLRARHRGQARARGATDVSRCSRQQHQAQVACRREKVAPLRAEAALRRCSS
jgi:hypothetical protein